ncbi:MAG: aminotransferase class I/II-fold pyridoxal phosphate-dependent enzyme [Rhodospirillaceae bacterium]|nr:aminotransferase class I/II-fold pyridoxal phosphate-dependent enzyme [Rhodospirillaceae bacterium]
MARRRHALMQLIGPNPLEVRIERIISPTEGVIDGRPVKLFGTNNYLGLTFDRDVQEAAIRAIREEGVGTTASRVASGNLPGHYGLEQELARFVGKRTAIVFSTGFQANLGAIAGLCAAGDSIVVDEDCHASIYDALQLSPARKIKFRHNDVAHLKTVLAGIPEPRARALVVVESVYSSAGDLAPLAEIVAAKKEAGCHLLVDEAHSLGMFGPHGEGYAAELGLLDDVDIFTGTFSKAFGLIGGFAAGNHPDFFCLRYTARPFMFTAAPPPSVMAAARVSLAKIAEGGDRRARLWRNAVRLREGFKALGVKVLDVRSPVVSAFFDDLTECYQVWERMLSYGFYANLLMPPASSHGGCIIRFSACSEHRPEDIEALLEAMGRAIAAVAGRQKTDGERRVHFSPVGVVVPTPAGARAAAER